MKSLFTCFKSFISKHFLRSTRRDPLLILDRFHWNHNTRGHHLFLLDVKRKKLKQLHIPRVTDSDMDFKMVGSCNGLLCIIHYSLDPDSTIFLWNPATRQTKRILEPQNALLTYNVPPHCLIGFYFNNIDSDYHVVRVHSFEDTNNACLDDSLSKICALRAEKYSQRTGLWREIKFGNNNESVTVNGCLFWTENSVTLEETLFWVAMEVSDKVSHEMIISFNTCNNVIRKIELPCFVKDCAEVHKKLVVYKDLVAVIICSETETMAQRLDLWGFYDKYEGIECWWKLQTIGMFSRLERPVGIFKNEILMSTDKVIHSVSGTIALLPEDDFGAEFSYNVFNHVGKWRFDTSYGGNVVVEEDGPVENEGFSSHDLFISNINKLSID
uniref:F-box protein At3g07870 n=2 Tax=Cajanus cajan TaxID=3821 RepID=A0A151UC26_CAJCA|nr:F-box protein At3g07870 [Cajanus cajan]